MQTNVDLPAKPKALTPLLFACSGQNFLRGNELQACPSPTGGLKGHHDFGDRKRVLQEHSGEVAVLGVPTKATTGSLGSSLQNPSAAIPERIDQGLRTAGVPVELHQRSVEIAVAKGELEDDVTETPRRRIDGEASDGIV